MNKTILSDIAKVAVALFLLLFVSLFGNSNTSGQTTTGTLTFSPNTVKDKQTFVTTLVGGPANTDTTIWQDDNDGKGFINYGFWKKTDPFGSIASPATMNCQGLAGKLVTQKVYLEYASGGISSTATITKDCRIGSVFEPPTPPTIPTVPTTPTTPTTPITPPTSSGGSLKFVKTLLSIPTQYNGGNQFVNDVVFFDGRFVFGGDCGVNMAGTGPGGGLWIVKEDGSSVIERQACLDAGSVSNVLYQHGNVHSDALHIDWSGKGIVRENSSWASCLGAARSDGSCSGGFGPGANRAVYYGASGNNSVSPNSSSPLHLYNNSLVVLKNRAIALNDSLKGFANLISLPDWKIITLIPQDFQKSYSLGFGDYAVTPYGDLYSVSEGGDVQLVKKLATNYSVSSGNFLPLAFAFDNSTTPAKLAVLEAPKFTTVFNPGNGQYTINNGDKRKIYVYKLSEVGVALDKTIDLPADFPGVNTTFRNSFGIWGDYLVASTPAKAYASTYEEGFANTGLELWKDGKKIATIKYPVGSPTYGGLIISKNGYISVLADTDNKTGKRGAYLYKIDGSVSTTPPITGPGPQQPLYDFTRTDCDAAYSGNAGLISLCKQVNFIMERTCKILPGIAFCQSSQTQ